MKWAKEEAEYMQNLERRILQWKKYQNDRDTNTIKTYNKEEVASIAYCYL